MRNPEEVSMVRNQVVEILDQTMPERCKICPGLSLVALSETITRKFVSEDIDSTEALRLASTQAEQISAHCSLGPKFYEAPAPHYMCRYDIVH